MLLSLGLRLGHWSALAQTDYFGIPVTEAANDAYFYWEWAGRLAVEGDWWSKDTYHPYDRNPKYDLAAWSRRWGGREILNWEPMYPYALGVLRWMGATPGGITLLQLLVGALTPLAVFELARRVADWRVALLAAGIAAGYGPLLANQGQIERDWLQALLEPIMLIALLWAWESKNPWRWGLAGVMAGLCILSKSTIVLFLPAALGWILWQARPRGWRWAGYVAGCWALGVMVGFSPWALRNAVTGAPVLALTNRPAVNIVCANAVDGTPVSSVEPPSLGPILDKAQGSVWIALVEAVKTHQGNWGSLLLFQWQKVRGFFDPFEVPSNYDYGYVLKISPWVRWLPGWGVLLPLALLGLAAAFPWRHPTQRLLMLFVLTALVALLLGMIVGRFRLTLLPVLAIWAGMGLIGMWDALRIQNMPRVWGLSLCLGLSLVAQHWFMPLPQTRQKPFAAIHPLEYKIQSLYCVNLHRYPEALSYLEDYIRQVEQYPDFQPQIRLYTLKDAWRAKLPVHVRFGLLLMLKGQKPQALEQIKLAADLSERLRPSAPEQDFLLADLFLQLEDQDAARRCLERSIADFPDRSITAKARQLLERMQEGGTPPDGMK